MTPKRAVYDDLDRKALRDPEVAAGRPHQVHRSAPATNPPQRKCHKKPYVVAPVTLPAVRKLIREVAARRGVALSTIVSRSHEPRAVAARAEVMLHLRMQGWSTPEIGRVFLMHHSNVLYSLKKLQQEQEPSYEIPCPDLSGEWAI